MGYDAVRHAPTLSRMRERVHPRLGMVLILDPLPPGSLVFGLLIGALIFLAIFDKRSYQEPKSPHDIMWEVLEPIYRQDREERKKRAELFSAQRKSPVVIPKSRYDALCDTVDREVDPILKFDRKVCKKMRERKQKADQAPRDPRSGYF